MRKNNRIPNFHNLGIHLRVLLLVCACLCLINFFNATPNQALSTGAISITALLDWLSMLALNCVQVTPALLLSLASLYLAYPMLSRLNYVHGMVAIFSVTLGISLICAQAYQQWLSPLESVSWVSTVAISISLTAISLYYLSLLQRAYSPAIAEARLQALQARIRPHFLFNSLNAVLSLIRSQPKVAETALEDMADLFRVLMADNRDLAPLAQEIALCRQYLSIEKLRLDERLECKWTLAQMPPDILIPPLILQPLIENAVYHGIEPLAKGGEIWIQIAHQGNVLKIHISNPYDVRTEFAGKTGGNKMALKNIQERLRLHYDLEASLHQHIEDGRYVVEITLPTDHRQL